MSEQSENKSDQNQASNSIFKTALFIKVPNNEGSENNKRSSTEYYNTPSMTPRTSDHNFKNYISSDLMRRLEESSPIKSHNSYDIARRFSELCLVSCDTKNEENEEESVSDKEKNSIIKLENMNKEEGENKYHRTGEPENVLNAMKNLKAKNFMLKTQILKPQNEYLITNEESEESSNKNAFSFNFPQMGDSQILSREPNSLFGNTMNFGNMNFSQNGFVSPSYNTNKNKPVARKDSSPFYSYYNDTSEYLSQNFCDNNYNSDKPCPGDKNFVNLDNANNYIKKVIPAVGLNKFDDTNIENINKFHQHPNNNKQSYNPAYNKFNIESTNLIMNQRSNDINLMNPERFKNEINNPTNIPSNAKRNNNYPNNVNKNMNLNNNQNIMNVNPFNNINSFHMNNQVDLEVEENTNHLDYDRESYVCNNINYSNNNQEQQMILNYMMNKDTPKKITNSQNNMMSNFSSSTPLNISGVSSEDDYIVEMFGRKGWICDLCNNFNYETRMKCNRCSVIKTPKRNVKGKTAKNTCDNKSVSNDSTSEDNNSSDRKKKKAFAERVGDWVCIKCKNLNFSFRVICNRCQLPKTESEKLFDNYMGNLMNYFKLNEMMQQQILLNNNQIPNQNQSGHVNTNSININNNYFNQYPNTLPGDVGNNPGIKNVPLPSYFQNNNGYVNSGGVNMSNYMGVKSGNVDSSVSHLGNKGSNRDYYKQEM